MSRGRETSLQPQGANRNTQQGLTSSEAVVHAGSLAILCATDKKHMSSFSACLLGRQLPAALTEAAKSASRAVCDSAVVVQG